MPIKKYYKNIMNNDFVIIRNVCNQTLLNKTKIDYEPQIIVNGKNGIYGQKLLTKLFVEDKIQDKYRFVCLIDEDCLLYNIRHLYDIVSYMNTNSIDIMGVSDGGKIDIRKHRPDVPNLFFVIIDTTKLKTMIIDELLSYSVKNGECGINYTYDDFEPYYKTLCFMNEKLNYTFVSFDAKAIIDGTTTEVYFKDKPICLHTWYARKYNIDNIQTKRIDYAIHYMQTKKNICRKNSMSNIESLTS